MAEEVASTREGMMIALPARRRPCRRLEDHEMAEFLREAAGQAWPAKHPRATRAEEAATKKDERAD